MLKTGLSISLLSLALAGCGPAGQAIQPGEWEISRSAGAPNGRQMSATTTRTCLRPSSGGDDPSRQLVIDLIDSSRCETGKVRVAGGRISGVLQCPEFYSFSAHEEPVRGRYSAESVEVSVDVPVFGHTLRQTVKARRAGDC